MHEAAPASFPAVINALQVYGFARLAVRLGFQRMKLDLNVGDLLFQACLLLFV